MNFVAIVTAFLLLVGCSAQRELMTCLRALESYESSSNCPSEAIAVSGPVGKKGPKGSIGEKGEKGETFISTEYVEKQEVSAMLSKMEEKLENLTREISKQVSVLEAKLENITDDLQRIKEQQEISCTAGLLYDNRCFRLLTGTGVRITRTEAVSRCVEANCALAEITSDEHQERVAAYIRQTHSSLSSGQRFIWLASTYEITEHPRRLITLRDGRRIPLVNWRNSYPRSGSSNTNVLLHVNPDIASNGNGVLNLETSFGGLPLCECSP